MNKYQIYMAGPDVFFNNFEDYIKDVKKFVVENGFDDLLQINFPIEYEIDLSQCKNQYEKGISIRKGNENAIINSHAVIANLNPFRSNEPDVGTSYEIGFARALKKNVIVFTNNSNKSMIEIYGSDFDEVSQSKVENFDAPFNLMLSPTNKEEIQSNYQDAIRLMYAMVKERISIFN